MAAVTTAINARDVQHSWARRQRTLDLAFKALTGFFAIGVLLLLGAIILALCIGAVPALKKFGLGFLTSAHWNPVKEDFGALVPVYGTVVTSIIAMLVGVP